MRRKSRWIQRFLQEGEHLVAVDRDPEWIQSINTDLYLKRSKLLTDGPMIRADVWFSPFCIYKTTDDQ